MNNLTNASHGGEWVIVSLWLSFSLHKDHFHCANRPKRQIWPNLKPLFRRGTYYANTDVRIWIYFELAKNVSFWRKKLVPVSRVHTLLTLLVSHKWHLSSLLTEDINLCTLFDILPHSNGILPHTIHTTKQFRFHFFFFLNRVAFLQPFNFENMIETFKIFWIEWNSHL